MRFAILGPVTVSQEGQAIALTPLERRIIAALLAPGHGRSWSATALMAAVWGDTHGRANTLKVHLSSLRRMLGERLPHGGEHGYRLSLQPDDTFDVDEFRRLAHDGENSVRHGRIHEALEITRQALSLWGNPPLPDLASEVQTLKGIKQALLSERQSTLLRWYAMHFALEQQESVLGELWREMSEDPASEPIAELLMKALHTLGHRAEALTVYSDLADHLQRTSSAAPSTRLTQLRDAIAHDRMSAHHASPAPLSVSPASMWPIPAQLPADTLDFTGRDTEVAQMVQLLTSAAARGGVPLIAVSGPPGVGKSALAIHAAQTVRDHFPDGQLYVHLGGPGAPRDPAEVLVEMLASLGIPSGDIPATGTERSALLRSLLASRQMLLVIDDAVSAPQIRPLLPGSAGCAVIITSRTQLTEPGMRGVHLEPLPTEKSLQLLKEIIGEGRVAAEPEATGRLLQVCGGFPLAVRIAAARLTTQPDWPLSFFADRLINRAQNPVQALALEASISDSYEALSPAGQRAFRHLALTGPSTFTAWQIAMLLGLPQCDELVQTLLLRSLISVAGVDPAGQPRYRQHDLLREYSAIQLAQHDSEHEMAVYRMLRGWLELSDYANAAIPLEPYLPPPANLEMRGWVPDGVRALIDADPMRWFAANHPNLMAAIRTACERREHRLALGLALRLSSWLYLHSGYREAEDMWRTIVHTAAAAGDQHRAAEARQRMAALVVRQPGGPERALGQLDSCVGVFQSVGDRRGLARALALRGHCAYRLALTGTGEQRKLMLGRACTDGEQALTQAQTVRDEHAELVCRRMLSLALSAMGQHEHAIQHGTAALALSRILPAHAPYETFALKSLTKVLLAAGRWEEALHLAQRGQDLSTELQRAVERASFAELAGDALCGLNRHKEAAGSFQTAATIHATDSRPDDESRCRTKYADAMIYARRSLTACTQPRSTR